MKNLIRRFKWIGILFGVLLMIAGVLVIVFTLVNIKDVNLALSIVVATLLFIIGAVYITAGVMQPLSNYFDPGYILGAVAIAIGVVCLIEQQIVPRLLVYVIAITLIALGVVYLIRGILLAINKMRGTEIALAILIAVIALTAGILCLCFQNKILTVIYVIGGALLIAGGILMIVYTVRKRKELK